MADLSDQFSDQQIDDFKEAFSLFDRNKDGTIYESQVLLVMKALGIHANEVDIRVSFVLSLMILKLVLILSRSTWTVLTVMIVEPSSSDMFSQIIFQVVLLLKQIRVFLII